MAQIVAFITRFGVPFVAPATLPTIRVRRTDTGALVATDDAMTELGDGLYRYTLATSPTLEYAYRIDADPGGLEGMLAGERYHSGSVSGITDQRIEVDIPALPVAVWAVDLTALLGFATAGEQLNAVRQFSFNRLESAPGSPGSLTLYRDDDLTVRAVMTLADHTGSGVVGTAGVPARRGAA